MPPHSPLHVGVVGPPAFAAALDGASGESRSATAATLDDAPDELDGTDCLLLDPSTAGATWRATAERVADARPRIPVVVLVGDDAEATVSAAIEVDAADWLPRSLCETRPGLVVDRLGRLAGRAGPSDADDPIERFDRPAATHDPETGRLRSANEALVDLLGYDRATLEATGLDALVAADSGLEPVVADAGATWEPGAHEWRAETAGGEVRWLATDVWPGTDGDEPCVFSVSRDVTERKRREQRFRLVAENVDEIIYIANEDFSEVRYLNPAYEDVWGRPVEEVYADATAFVDAIDPRDREAFEEKFARMREDIERGEAADSYEFEFRIRRPDGERRWVFATGYPVETATGEGWYVGIAEDITERRELERTYRELFDKSSAAITFHDPETKEMVGVNDTMCDLLGYDRETLLDLGTVGISAADQGYTEERAAEIIDRIMASGESEEYEWVVEDADGDRHVLLVTGTPATINGQDRFLSASQEITERKRRKREYEQIFDGVNDAIAVHDPDTGEMLEANERLCELTGYDSETLLDRGAAGITAPVEAFQPEHVPEIIDRVMAGEDVDPYEQAIETADGDRRWLEVNPTRATIGGEERFLAIARDVTARRERQRRLETERDRRSVLFENTSDPIIAVEFEDGDPYVTEINSAFADAFGVDAERAVDRRIADVVVPAEERAEYERIRERALAGEPVETEVRRETTDGVRDFLLRVLPFESGGSRHAYVWYTDITERKRRERRIEEERQKYSTLVEQSTDAVVVVRDGQYVFVNDRFCEITGYDEVELLDMPFQNVFTPASRELVRERYERRVAGESPPNQYDVEVETADGDRLTLELSVSRIQHDGEPATMANFRDVTERRGRERTIERLQTATERLQSAETTDEVYRIAVETARDVLGLPMTACWHHDPAAERLTYVDGTAPVAEMRAGSGPTSFAPGDKEYELFDCDEATTYDPSRYHDHNPLDCCIVVPLGDHGLLAAGERGRDGYEPYRLDAAQVLAGHATTALDRVERSKQLRESERRLGAIIDRIDEAIFLAPATELTESDPAPDFVSSGYESIWGQPLDGLHETYDEGFFGTLHPDDYDGYRAFLDRLVDDVEGGEAAERYTREYRIERPDGEVRWVHSDFYPADWTDDAPRVVIVSRDVTAEKRRERTIESFHDATAELTTADTVADASRMAVDAAAEVFDLPATAVYRYDESTATLEPATTGPALPDAATLPALTDDDTRAWDAFVSETMYHVSDGTEPLGDGRSDGETLLFPLGGNGLLVVCQSGETLDTDAASIIAATLEAALNRLRGERRLESRRAELEAQAERAQRLESITELTRRVEAAITGHSSRRGIQEAVCDELVDRDPFDAAWVAAADVGTDRLTPRATAGIDADTVERVLDGTDPGAAATHPMAEAWEAGEPRVVDDLVGSGRRLEWQRRLLTVGAGSVCAVPLAYSGITYGVLAVVADDPGEFDDREVDVLSQLGTSIGYAIAAIERRRALESDDTLELEFRGSGVALPFARLARETACRVRHERTVRRQDGSVSVYYTVHGDPDGDVADAASTTLPGDVEVAARRNGEAVVERRGSSWFGAFVSEYGGVLRRGHAADGNVSLVVELPREADIRTIVDRFRAEFPALELTAQRQHRETESTPSEVHQQIERRLSDRQYEALETAHAMGYFEWPRESSGEEVAETLGITQPTINKHLRLGERKVFDLLLGRGDEEDDDRP